MAINPTSFRARVLRSAAFIGLAMALPTMSSAFSGQGLSSFIPAPIDPVATTLVAPVIELDNVPSNGCPTNMARVGASCVDMYEASLVEIAADGTEAAFSPYEPPNGHHVRAVSQANVVPQAHISMMEAKSACKASGKRLCGAKEWKTACKGPEATRYPYGNTRVEGACVDTNRTAPMTVLHQGEHTARTMNDPLANQQDNTLEATGTSPACTNGFGVHDMVGNVHEWTDDASFRGGYYLDTTINGEGCEYRTTAHSPVYYDYSTGFRCCADPGSVDEG